MTMNHCLDCNSMYSEPGTCNCYAPGGKRAPLLGWGNGADVVLDNHTRTFTVCPDCGMCCDHRYSHFCMGRLTGGSAQISIRP